METNKQPVEEEKKRKGQRKKRNNGKNNKKKVKDNDEKSLDLNVNDVKPMLSIPLLPPNEKVIEINLENVMSDTNYSYSLNPILV